MNGGRNSGHQAINLAWHFGARRFVLVGFDCTIANGQRHWFGDHPGELNVASPYDEFAACFHVMAQDLAADGCEVINCSPLTALTCFKKGTLDEALADVIGQKAQPAS